MRWILLLSLLATLLGGGQARADRLETALAELAGDSSDPPAHPAELFWRLTLAPERLDEAIERAASLSTAFTDTFLSTLRLSDPQAQALLPGLYVIRDEGPPPGERPPAWADVRWTGLALLEAFALQQETGRDRRLRRELAAARERIQRRSPSQVGGLVVLWEDWWADRGGELAFYLDPAHRPDVSAWRESLSAPPGDPHARAVVELLGPLAEDRLRRHLLLAELSPRTHAHLAAECIRLLLFYQVDFEREGFPARSWDATEGRPVGFYAPQLREVALQMLERVTPHIPSGVDEDALIVDWLLWWRRARMEARYHRDPERAPSFERWLGELHRAGEEGALPLAVQLRELYLAEGVRDLLLEQLDGRYDDLVAELIEWLGYDREAAAAAGFRFAHRRTPLRPRPNEQGELFAIPWVEVQAFLRQMLASITGEVGLEGTGLDGSSQNLFWTDWWEAHRGEARWYREGVSPPADAAPLFHPQRGRAGG